jgi:zinc finger BED domain-containing protein 5/7/8/9
LFVYIYFIKRLSFIVQKIFICFKNGKYKGKCKKKARKYPLKFYKSFLKYGIHVKTENGENKPYCLLCKKVFSINSCKHSYLKRHQIKQHSTFLDKDESYFQKLVPEEEQIIADLPDQIVLASNRLSYKIAKAGKNHTIGDDLIKPAIIDAVSTVLDDATAKKFEAIALSATTVQRRIKTMSTHLEDEIIRKLLLSSTLAMQLDESTDVANLAELLVYVRYAQKQ